MKHDRIHAREPSHHRDRWEVGTIEQIRERDGHCVVDVVDDTGDTVELVVTFAVRDLFVSRLDLTADESPVGSQVWFRRKRGQ